MNNLMDAFQEQLSPDLVNYLSKSIGGEDKQSTTVAAESIFSVLMNAMANNAKKENGAEGLLKAVSRDHDGSLLNNAVALLSGMQAPENPKTLNSAGILSHLLGSNQGNVVQKISKVSGLDAMDIGQLMMKVAPIAMGVLGKQQKSQGLDAGGLLNLLLGSTTALKQNNPQASIFERLLDQDGDGSIIDDIAGFGLKNLGKFFRK